MTWRQATRDELFAYYTEEFPEYLNDIPGFVTPTGPKEFGIAFREPYPVHAQGAPDRTFIRRQTREADDDGRSNRPRSRPGRRSGSGWRYATTATTRCRTCG